MNGSIGRDHRFSPASNPFFTFLATDKQTAFLVSAASHLYSPLPIGSSAVNCAAWDCMPYVNHPRTLTVRCSTHAKISDSRNRQYLPRRKPGIRSAARRRVFPYTQDTGTFSMSATSSTVSNAVDEDSRIERTCVGIDGIEVTGSQSVREIYLGWSAKMKTVPDAFMNKLEETAITTLEHVRDKTFTNETVELDGK